ncbi:hypothetical protein HPB47_024236 [Ixodes persulcatus]|uniref:Uncharacterized protein n=1 Tax=Ixodes persulcatus TaxID=34615 RepID=A0AC60Q4V2_IXOPE|nr:hypothetical protein HPB47_024236 [Ixodes persulcatus]
MVNMDQTMVQMDTTANGTNKLAGTSTVRISNTGCARQGFTVALAACASGHKLQAFVVLKEQSEKIPTRAFTSLGIPRDNNFSSEILRKRALLLSWGRIHFFFFILVKCFCHGFEERLDDLGEFLEWLGRIWVPNVDDVRQLLVLDQVPIHKTQAAKDTIQERDTNLPNQHRVGQSSADG